MLVSFAFSAPFTTPRVSDLFLLLQRQNIQKKSVDRKSHVDWKSHAGLKSVGEKI